MAAASEQHQSNVVTPVPAAVAIEAKHAAAVVAAEEEWEDTRLIPLVRPVNNGSGNDRDSPNKDGLDIISRRALEDDKRAVLFHHIYPFASDDNRTLSVLMRMTGVRAAIVKLPTLENVRDYLTLAMTLRTSLDRYNTDPLFQAVHLAYPPAFAMGRLQSPDLTVDIVYWLGRLGLDSLWLTLDMLNKEIEKVFDVPVHVSPLENVTAKVGQRTSPQARAVASVAFLVLACDVEARWGAWWKANHVFYPTASAEVRSEAMRLKWEYISALMSLISATVELTEWVTDKFGRQGRNAKVNYSLMDVSTLNLCMKKIEVATEWITGVEKEHTLGVELFHEELYETAKIMRYFAIAKEITTRPAELPFATWYLLQTPRGWFKPLEEELYDDSTDEELQRQREEKEPEETKQRFSKEVAQDGPTMLDYVKLRPGVWPVLRLDCARSSARRLHGMFKAGGPGNGAAAAAAAAGK